LFLKYFVKQNKKKPLIQIRLNYANIIGIEKEAKENEKKRFKKEKTTIF
jgi:hypothetical protein